MKKDGTAAVCLRILKPTLPMNNTLAFLVVFFLLVETVQASDDIAVFKFQLRGVDYVSVVTKTLVEKSPSWKEEMDSPPPLPMQRAMSLALKKAGEMALIPGAWGCIKVRLQLVATPSHWVYVFDCYPLGDSIGRVEEMQIVVLMSGFVVTPARLNPTRQP